MPRPAQTAAWTLRPGPFMLRAQREFGDTFTIRIATEPPWVMLAHPDAVREVFTGDPALLHAGRANVILRPFLGRASVLLLDGREHLRRRKLMLPPFHGARMAGYRDMVAAIAREHIAAWPRGEPLSLAPRMQAITLDVVLRVIFGMQGGPSNRRVARPPPAHDGVDHGHDVAARDGRGGPGPDRACRARRSEIYPEPARFRPERFIGEDPQGGTYTWIPFGGGVRRCIGAAFALMELRVVLAELGRALDAGAVAAAPEATRRRAITMVPARGAEVVLS
jgi:cytochrome P450